MQQTIAVVALALLEGASAFQAPAALAPAKARAAMLGFLHVILIEGGARFPGYLSPSSGLKFSDVPSGMIASLEALPTAGWLQIMLTTCMMETGYFIFEYQGYVAIGAAP